MKLIKEEKYVYQQTDRCIRCGKKLKSYTSKLVGYGPSCYKKYLMEKQKGKKNRRLF
mgnify:CR=1 FL=1